jgi:hypothetical protein
LNFYIVKCQEENGVGRKCVGFVEAVGLAAALQAADTIAKSANIRLLGYEYSGYDGHILIKFEGNAGAIKAAAEAAAVAIHKVHTDFDQTTAVNLEKGLKMQNWMRRYITYILPLIVLFIFFFGLYDKFF